MAFRTPLHVRFGDIDLAGIVYYPRFMHFCHVAMEEFFDAIVGVDYPTFLTEHRLGLPVIHLETDYHRPLRYGEKVEIEVAIERVGGSSVHWRYRFLREGSDRPSAECRIVTVCVSVESFQKAALPAWLVEKLRPSVEPRGAMPGADSDKSSDS
ncbi:MAG: thioesterase family protein [Thermoanaerobaculia bacterium]